MNLLYIPLVLVGILVGGGGYCYFTGTTIDLSAIIGEIQSKIEPILTTWNTLPSTVQAVIIGAVPTLLMVFFAWTKNRAMQQLQETQQAAGQQIKQISGEAYQAQQQLGVVAQQRDTLQQQYNALASENSGIVNLQDTITSLKTQLQEKTVANNAEVNALKDLLSEYKMKEKVVVK